MVSKHYNNNKFPKYGKEKTSEKGERCERCGAFDQNLVADKHIATVGKKKFEYIRWICYRCYKELKK